MKKEIFKLLRENSDQYISGEKISEALGVTRTTVWKHIKKLREEGYEIDSVSNKGYRLKDKIQFNELELDSLIEKIDFLDEAFFLETVGSTNDYAKTHFGQSHKEVIVIADEQTKGKGRLGNYWASEKGEGIWMSLLLRPEIIPEQASKITLTAAAAMTLALEKVIDKKVNIKWPNDIILDNKKVCGILTEMSAELGHVNYIVLGIGLNVSQMTFDDTIKDKATSLKLTLNKEIERYDIIKYFLQYFEELYQDFVNNNMESIIAINRSHSITIGKNVHLIRGGEAKEVFAEDIDENGELIVNDNGVKSKVSYGEVSVRGINGYV